MYTLYIFLVQLCPTFEFSFPFGVHIIITVTVQRNFSCLFTADLTSISKVTSWNNLPYKKRFTKRGVYAKDYCKADHSTVYCFFITILRLTITAFFRFTDVTKETVRSSDIIASSYLVFSLEEKNGEALWSRCIEV